MSRTKLRKSSPAPVRSTRARATWATASTARARFERSSRKPPDDCSFSSSRVRARSSRDHRRAGAAPNSSPAAIDSPKVNASVTGSMPTSSSLEMSPGTSAGTARSTIDAAASPSTPPPALIITLSVSSCRTRRPRFAPSAAHTASARWRATPRASSSPATLMQAISSTRAVAKVRAKSAGRYAPTISSSNGATRTAFSDGASPSRPPPMASTGSSLVLCRRVLASAAACSGDTPGARRPRASKAIMTVMRGCPASAAGGGVNGRTTKGVQRSLSGCGK